MDNRPLVNILPRRVDLNGHPYYYSPDGHAIGPFDSEEAMEADILAHFVESSALDTCPHCQLTFEEGCDCISPKEFNHASP